MSLSRLRTTLSLLIRFSLLFGLGLAAARAATPAPAKIILLAGRPSHPPGAHEHRAGMLLLQKCLVGFPGVVTEVYDMGWPTVEKDGQRVDNNAVFEGASAVVIYSDGGRNHPALQGERLALLDRLARAGVGIGLIHYAVEPTIPLGQKEFIQWTGGAFEIHHSVNPHWEADFTSYPEHAVTRGVKPFRALDEWYFNMRFRENMTGVTPVLTAVPPESTMSRKDGPHEGNPTVRAMVAQKKPQTMMWLSESPTAGGGRGFGFTGGHFHAGWKNDEQRKLVLNAIVWIAGREVPANGVVSTVTDADLAVNLDPKTPRPAAAK
ncbi:MAG TPA: ThuA domain-containing protein [Opitutaceae bacterium]